MHDSAAFVEEQLARVCDEADRLRRELHAVKDVARNRLQLIDQLKAEKRTAESNARYWERSARQPVLLQFEASHRIEENNEQSRG